jgi:dipeptidyl aminopeptidase/acylaminoacyl peptidase
MAKRIGIAAAVALASLGLMAGAPAGDEARPSPRAPTIDQSLEMQTVGQPKISPDGRRVIWEESRTNWASNAFETDLWIADATGEGRRRLTSGVKSSRSAAWSPDGKWIAFLSDRPGQLPDSPADKTQLYVMPADGGEAQQVARFEAGVDGFEWAPDSNTLILSAEGPAPKAMKARKDYFGDYHVVHADYQMVRLWRVQRPTFDVAGRAGAEAELELLTPGDDFSVTEFSVSPDGKQVAFSAQRDPDLISGTTARLYVLSLADRAVTKLTGEDGPDVAPAWSPDSSKIAFLTAAGSKFSFYANQKIAVVDRTGGKPKLIAPGFDEDPALVKWTAGGLWFNARQKTEAGLFRLDPDTGAVVRVALDATPLATQVSMSPAGTVAYVGAGPNLYPEIYVADAAKPKPVKLTSVSDQVSGFDTARREVVRWTSTDGAEIEGVLYTPAKLQAGKRYPLLVVIHGGPTGVDTPTVGPDRYYPIERFVAKGALVLRPNYRGSAGYGEAFRSLNVRNLGVGDYWDVISGVDALIKKGLVDPKRVGAMGWSEGGYISAFITTTSDRFQAVSVGAGISDWTTYYVNTDITPFTRQYLKATPWEDPAIYAKTSPITYVAGAHTPTLIQHGGADRRVPIPNGYELRQALEDKGVPVKMVIYDGFGHPINKPKQQRAVMEENENWFAHYIWGEPLAPSLTPAAKPEEKKAEEK